MNEPVPSNPIIYPPKPEFIETTKSSLGKSIVSLLLFIGAFYFYFEQNLTFVLILALVVFFHELGHFLAMKIFNYNEVKMFFIPLFGALVTGKKEQVSQTQRAFIILAGPIPGIIVGLIMIYLGVNNYVLMVIAHMLLVLNLFNLIPISPLDGGALIETIFFNSKEKLQALFIILSIIGSIVIAFFLESYFLLIIPFILMIRLSAQSQLNNLKTYLEVKNVDYSKSIDEMSDQEYWLIRKDIIHQMKYYKDIDGNKFETSKHEKSIQRVMTSLAKKKINLDMSRISKLFIIGIWLLFTILPALYFFDRFY